MNLPQDGNVFAVVRIDSDFKHADRDNALLRDEPGSIIKVVSVWADENMVVAETERLNALNEGKSMAYFWQQAHVRGQAQKRA